jgi:hypothetical protein
MKQYHIFIALFFLLIASGSSLGAINDHLLTEVIMQGTAANPTLTILQQNADGSNQIIEDVPEVYPAVVPYFLEYIKNNIEEIKGIQGKDVAAIAISYGYPDNLEINLLSDTVEKITRKIRPDEKLHGLRIRSAMAMFNFLKEEEGSNVAVGFQLFPDDLDYTGMDIKPDYEFKKGSWAIVWERSVRVYTRIYRTVRVINTPRVLVVQAITRVVRTVRVQSRISIIGRGGRVLRVVAVRNWVGTSVTTKVETFVIPKKTICKCYLETQDPPPASPVDEGLTIGFILCGDPFYVQGEESCSVKGKRLYPKCDYCR